MLQAWLNNITLDVKLAFRDRQAIFWSYIFPVFFLFLFASVFARGRTEMVGNLLPGLLTISIMSASFFGMSVILVTMRERGVLRRYQLAPLSPWFIITSKLTSSLVISFSTLLLQLLLAKLFYKVSFVGNPGAIIFVLLLGSLTFLSLGFIIASLAENVKTAQVLGNLLFFPLMFLGGAAFPVQFLPPKLQQLAAMLPSNYLIRALSNVLNQGQSLLNTAKPLGALLLILLVAVFLAAKLFRWEAREPMPWQQKIWAAALLAVFVGAALFTHSE